MSLLISEQWICPHQFRHQVNSILLLAARCSFSLTMIGDGHLVSKFWPALHSGYGQREVFSHTESNLSRAPNCPKGVFHLLTIGCVMCICTLFAYAQIALSTPEPTYHSTQQPLYLVEIWNAAFIDSVSLKGLIGDILHAFHFIFSCLVGWCRIVVD